MVNIIIANSTEKQKTSKNNEYKKKQHKMQETMVKSLRQTMEH